MKLVAIDAHNGHYIPNNVTSSQRKRSPVLAISAAVAKLLENDGIRVKSTSSILRSKAEPHAASQVQVIGDYSKNTRQIDLLLKIESFDSVTNKGASGVVVCYSTAAAEAEVFYKQMTSVVHEKGFNMRGNRDKPYAYRPNFAIVGQEILSQFGDSGVIRTRFHESVSNALDSYHKGRGDVNETIAKIKEAADKSGRDKPGILEGKMRMVERKLKELNDSALLYVDGVKGLLVNVGFSSNPHDLKILQGKKGQKAIAEGISEGAKAVLRQF